MVSPMFGKTSLASSYHAVYYYKPLLYISACH